MHMLKKINSIFGFSDHTLGNVAAMFAIFNGARVIEKHLTLSKKLNGPDHYASMEPKEFKNFIENIRNLELLLNNKKIVNNEINNKKLVRKFLVAKTKIFKRSVFHR